MPLTLYKTFAWQTFASLRLFTCLVYVTTYCVPIAHLRQNKPFQLLYLGHAQITRDTKPQDDSAKLLSYEHWSTEKVYKRQGWYRTKKLAIFAIYQNRSEFALLGTFKNRHYLDSLPKQIELSHGLSWKSFHCRFTENRQCEQCLFNTFHSNSINDMRISFLTFPVQIPEIRGETCMNVLMLPYVPMFSPSFLVHDFGFFPVFASPPHS